MDTVINKIEETLLANKGCNKCYLENKVFKIEDIEKQFLKIHQDYNYDFTNYKNVHTKIKIICIRNIHFIKKFQAHLQGKGCPVCRRSLGERKISILGQQQYNILNRKI